MQGGAVRLARSVHIQDVVDSNSTLASTTPCERVGPKGQSLRSCNGGQGSTQLGLPLAGQVDVSGATSGRWARGPSPTSALRPPRVISYPGHGSAWKRVPGHLRVRKAGAIRRQRVSYRGNARPGLSKGRGPERDADRDLKEFRLRRPASMALKASIWPARGERPATSFRDRPAIPTS
jgi:hypothetical protein